MLLAIKEWWSNFTKKAKVETPVKESAVADSIKSTAIANCHKASYSTLSVSVMYGDILTYTKHVKLAKDHLLNGTRVYAPTFTKESVDVYVSSFFMDSKSFFIDEVEALIILLDEIKELYTLHKELDNELDNNPINQHNEMALIPLIRNAVQLTQQIKIICENIT